MRTPQTIPPPSAESGEVHDVKHRIELMRAHAAALDPHGVLEGLVSDVAGAIERITIEHAGMAEELLGVYEQLGIVFEVTRQLPGVQTESAVIDLFVDSLSRSFPKHEVFVMHRRSDEPHRFAGSPTTFEEWFASLVRRAIESKSVQVDHPPAEIAPVWADEVMVGPVFAGDSSVCTVVRARGAEVEQFRASDMMLLESLMTYCGDLIRNHRLVHELRQMSLAVVRSLVNAVDQKDEYTSGHSLRVGYFATMLGEAMGLSRDDLRMLQWSALLHDVGKIGVRDDVLKKQGQLTPEEFNHIKEHPVRSYHVVREVPQLAGALHGVLHHHEHYDGNGYPARIAGDNIPLQARIIQIADMFDALTSNRSYRRAFSWRRALEIMNEEAGLTIDPILQRTFNEMIRGRLEDDADGWRKMVEAANLFTQDMAPLAGAPHGA